MKHETRRAKSEKVFKNYTRVENYYKYSSPAVFGEKTPKKTLSTTLPSRFFDILFTFTSQKRTCLPAKKNLGISKTTQLASATSK